MLVVHPSSQCDVCLDAYTWEAPARLPHAIPCGHIFCRTCLENVSPPHCPLCRKEYLPNRIKKLHIDRPDNLADEKEIELLKRLALGFDSSVEDQNIAELNGEVAVWLDARDENSSRPLREIFKALPKFRSLQRRRERDRAQIAELQRQLSEQLREAIKLAQCKAEEQAYKESLMAQVEQLKIDLTEHQMEIQALRSELDACSQPSGQTSQPGSGQRTANPLPPPPEPIPLENLPNFARAAAEYGLSWPSGMVEPSAADVSSPFVGYFYTPYEEMPTLPNGHSPQKNSYVDPHIPGPSNVDSHRPSTSASHSGSHPQPSATLQSALAQAQAQREVDPDLLAPQRRNVIREGANPAVRVIPDTLHEPQPLPVTMQKHLQKVLEIIPRQQIEPVPSKAARERRRREKAPQRYPSTPSSSNSSMDGPQERFAITDAYLQEYERGIYAGYDAVQGKQSSQPSSGRNVRFAGAFVQQPVQRSTDSLSDLSSLGSSLPSLTSSGHQPSPYINEIYSAPLPNINPELRSGAHPSSQSDASSIQSSGSSRRSSAPSHRRQSTAPAVSMAGPVSSETGISGTSRPPSLISSSSWGTVHTRSTRSDGSAFLNRIRGFDTSQPGLLIPESDTESLNYSTAFMRPAPMGQGQAADNNSLTVASDNLAPGPPRFGRGSLLSLDGVMPPQNPSPFPLEVQRLRAGQRVAREPSERHRRSRTQSFTDSHRHDYTTQMMLSADSNAASVEENSGFSNALGLDLSNDYPATGFVPLAAPTPVASHGHFLRSFSNN